MATNPGRKLYFISKWLQIPNTTLLLYSQSTSMSPTASDFIPIFLQQRIRRYLYFNHGNCSTICCYLFTPCHKYFKCFHRCSGLLAPMYTHISLVFHWTHLIWLIYFKHCQSNYYSQQVITFFLQAMLSISSQSGAKSSFPYFYELTPAIIPKFWSSFAF